LNPSIDIDATHDVQQWRIHVLVVGTARSPELSVHSDPPLPESDVLSLLLFGRRAGDLDADERYSLGERATTMLAGMATAPLEAALASQLGLDLLRIDTAGSGSSVTVGKYLGERAMLRIEQSLEQSTRRELTIEYSLTRKLRMDVSTDERGKSGADLFYEFDR
jgi:translocation and assembly module TamB